MVNKNYIFLLGILFFSLLIINDVSAGINVGIRTPINNSFFGNNFQYNVTSDFNITNVSYIIWNSSGILIWNFTADESIYNVTYFSDTGTLANSGLIDGNNYTFNILAYNNQSEFNWSFDGNHTFTYEGTTPNLLINYPVNNQFLNTRYIPFNLTVFDIHYNYTNFQLYNETDDSVNETQDYTNGSYIKYFNVTYDGNYSMDLFSYDTIGNFNSSTTDFTVDTTTPQISFSSGTENNLSNKSRSWIYANVSMSDLYLSNITFKLYNSSYSQINSTTLGAGNRSFNFTTLADGTYYYNVSVYDLAINYNITQTRIITLDTGAPIFSNLINKTVAANLSFSYDIDATDNISLISSYWLNDTTNFTINSSGVVVNSTTLNYSGIIYLTVYVNDSLNNTQSGIFYINVTTDSFLPTITLVAPAVDATLDDSSVTYTFRVTDLSLCTCYLYVDGDVVFSNSSVFYNNSLNTFVDSDDDGDYTWKIRCVDFFGNSANSSERDYTVDTNSSSTNSNTGGTTSLTNTLYWTYTYAPNATALSNGYNKLLALKERVKFKVGTAEHHIGIVGISSITVTINVSSTPQQATLTPKEERKFDVNSDGYYDVFVRLNELRLGKANITIMTISEKIPTSGSNSTTPSQATPSSSSTTQPVNGNSTGGNQNSGNSPIKSNTSTYVIIVVAVLIIIVMVLIGITYFKSKHLSSNNLKTNDFKPVIQNKVNTMNKKAKK